MSERVLRLALQNGEKIDFHRDEDGTVRICRQDQCAIIPHGTGKLTTELFALLEPMCEIIEEDEIGEKDGQQ